jgi:hypothetical protein
MSEHSNRSRRVSGHDLRIDLALWPGWVSASDQTPLVGDEVMCVEGSAQVVRVMGRTGDGSRLLELVLPGSPRRTFFAAASNVLLAPRAPAP